jgi:hypothetical protein
MGVPDRKVENDSEKSLSGDSVDLRCPSKNVAAQRGVCGVQMTLGRMDSMETCFIDCIYTKQLLAINSAFGYRSLHE